MHVRRLFRIIALGLKSLALHKLRSTLTVLGVVFGVASVIVMLAVGEGAKSEALQQIKELGATNIILQSVKPTGAANESQSGAIRYGLTLKDLREIQSAIPTIESIVYSRYHRRQFRRRERKLDGRIVGVSPGYRELFDLQLQSGRLLSTLDHEGVSLVAMLGAEAASTLFPMEDPIGKSIRVGEDLYLQVIGVLMPNGGARGREDNSEQGDQNRDVYIPFRLDRARFGEVVSFDRTQQQLPEILEISQITIGVSKTDQVKPTAELVEQIIQSNHPAEDTSLTVPLELLRQAERTQRMFTLVLGAIASVSLVVGGIGIMNIMLATVTERTREIGIRRAIGARRSDIIRQFLVETIVLSSLGGLVGLIGGLAIANLLPQFFELHVIVRAWSPILAFSISVLIGIIFGAFPASHAAGLDPIEALRHE